MKELFKDSFRESTIFKNQRALLPEYAPQELVHRDGELGEIANALKPALNGMEPQNLFIYGSTGTGKTSSVKYVFEELHEYAQKVACIYINCWQNSSKQAVLSQIAEYFQEPIPRRGLSNEEILHRVVGRAKYDKRVLIVCLDEVDRLFHRGEEEVLYDLSRLNENYKWPCGIIAISNNADILATSDQRVRSSMRFKSMEYMQYTPSQLKDILKQRAKDAFLPGTCSEDVIALCAAQGAKAKGDARVALEMLVSSARLADSAGRKKIELTDVKKASSTGSQATLQKNYQFMSDHEKLIVQLLRDAKDAGETLTSTELMDRFNQLKEEAGEEPIGERQFRNYVNVFEDAGLIETEIGSSPQSQKGKTKIIRIIK